MKKSLKFVLELVSDKFKKGADKAGRAWEKLHKRMSKTGEANKKASTSLDRLNASVEKTNKQVKQGSSLFKRFGKSMVAQITLALGLTTAITRLFSAFAAGAKHARDMEKGFAEINTLYDGPGGLTENTKKLIVEQSNLFGRDIQTNQKAFYDIVSSGITDQAKAMKVLEASNKLAVGGLTETGTAADLLTSAMNSWGHETYTATQITDIFFQTVKKGKTTINEMAGSLGQVFPIASKAGASLEEVGAAIATMTAGRSKNC